MKRRDFLKLSGLGLGAAAIPLNLLNFIPTYTKPIWSYVKDVSAMPTASVLHQYNYFLGHSFGEDQYVRQIRFLKAARNINKSDIVNEFYQKYSDDNALLTTCGIEDNYDLRNDSFDQSFRRHLTISQVKEIIANIKERSERDSNPKVRKNGYSIERFAKEMIENRAKEYDVNNQNSSTNMRKRLKENVYELLDHAHTHSKS